MDGSRGGHLPVASERRRVLSDVAAHSHPRSAMQRDVVDVEDEGALARVSEEGPRVEGKASIVRLAVPVVEGSSRHLELAGGQDPSEDLHCEAPRDGDGPVPPFVVAYGLLQEVGIYGCAAHRPNALP